jgi:hypothetical protein
LEQALDGIGVPVQDTSQIFFVSIIHMTENATFNTIPLAQTGSVNDISIESAGSSCTSPGTLGSSGGGGIGFSATFQVQNGSVTNISINSGGWSYTSIPLIHIDSGGSGCLSTSFLPLMSLPGEYYGSLITTLSGKYTVSPVLLQRSGLTATFFNNSNLLGSPYFSAFDESVEREFENDAVLSASWDGYVKIIDGSFSPSSSFGRSVRDVFILKRGDGCLSSGILSSWGGGGSGFQASYSIGSYYGDSGVLKTGITTITILNAGSGYSSAPNLILINNNSGCFDFKLQAVLMAESGMETLLHVESDG